MKVVKSWIRFVGEGVQGVCEYGIGFDCSHSNTPLQSGEVVCIHMINIFGAGLTFRMNYIPSNTPQSLPATDVFSDFKLDWGMWL